MRILATKCAISRGRRGRYGQPIRAAGCILFAVSSQPDPKRYYRRRIGLGFDGPAKPVCQR